MALSTGLALYGAGPATARSPAEPIKSAAASLVVGDGARAHLRFDLRRVGRQAGTARRRLHLHLQVRRAGSGSSLVVRRVGRARPFARVTLPGRGAVSVDVTRVVGRARVVRLVLTRSRGRAVLVGRGPRAPRLDVEPASRPRPSPTVTPTPTPQATSTPSTQPPPAATPTPSPTPTATSSPEPKRTPTPNPTATPTPQPVVVGAAGDIACDPAAPEYNGGAGTATACHHRAISDLLLAEPQLDAVLTLGDLQYESATLEQFLASYEPTWGRVKTKTHPVPGNHEYQTPRAAGYFDYWGSLAGERTKGYYSFDLGAWHVVALNSVCWEVGGCGPGSPQEQWLRADLAASRAKCTLAYWHHPRFASGSHGDDPMTHALWAALHEEGAELVLSGHDHSYERLAPVNPQGLPDPEAGIRSFVVGTGGKSLRAAGGVPNPASEVFDSSAYGYLRLSLRATGYDWRFVSEPGAPFTDSGSGSCH